MRPRIRNLLAVTAIAAGAAVVNVAPANAACLYRLSNYDGGYYCTGSADLNYSDNHFSNGYTLNDRVSSVTNYGTSRTLRLYQNSYWGGEYREVGAHGRRSFSGTWFDNRASSHRWLL